MAFFDRVLSGDTIVDSEGIMKFGNLIVIPRAEDLSQMVKSPQL